MQQTYIDKPHYHYSTAYGLMLVFLAPMLAACLLYTFRDHFQFKTMHSGELLTPAIKLDSEGLSNQGFEGQWQLLHITPTHCEIDCHRKIERLHRIHQALGKDQSRLTVRQITLPTPSKLLSDDTTWIVDPRGFLIMHYVSEYPNDKGILEDIRRLLRFSHVK